MQSDWESNCPRAFLLHYCITVRGREQRTKGGEALPQEASPFCMDTRELEEK